VGRLAAASFIALFSLALAPACSAENVGAQSEIVGTWRGNSECAVKNGPCRNETNIYRFSVIAARPGWFSGDGSKLVDDKEISMGPLDFRYDPTTHILQSNTPHGVFRLVVDGDKMEGALLLSDATVYRRIHLKRVK